MKVSLAVCGMFIANVIALHAQATATFTSLWSFNQTNGAYPQAGLAQGPDGNFYGTTAAGGAYGDGTIFQLTPGGIVTNLVSFNGTNGNGPRDALLSGLDGNLYGTTYGSNSFGTVFQVTTNGILTTLHAFLFIDGGYPIGGLVQDSSGNFYGTTAIGGANSSGTVFKLATNGTLQNLVNFDISGFGGNSPYAGLVQGPNGSLYGTTYQGGTNNAGTIYKIDTNGVLTTLASFNETNGANPYAGLIVGPDGALYGTTFGGGTNGFGTIFKLDTNNTLTTLVSFANTNGANPQAALLRGLDGNFYGTTSAGGDLSVKPEGHGTVFELDTNGILTSLILFNGTNGDSPRAGLIEDANGNFYGTTAYGGTNDLGTVFRFNLTVPRPRFLAVAATNGVVTLTWSATVPKGYQMLYKSSLNQPSWSNLNNSVTATNAVMTSLDTPGPDPQRFYQILLLP